MAWVFTEREYSGYSLALTDGYVAVPEGHRETRLGRSDVLLEQGMAAHLYRLAKRTTVPRWHRAETPELVHVWVIGSDRWSRRRPDVLQWITEDERDPTYRIVIGGGTLDPNVWPYGGNWLSAAGMKRKKKHQNIRAFKQAGNTLLEMMAAHYERSQAPPTPVLAQFNLPICFYGDMYRTLE